MRTTRLSGMVIPIAILLSLLSASIVEAESQGSAPRAPQGVCGDFDGDGMVFVSDMSAAIGYLFAGGAGSPDFSSADCDGYFLYTLRDIVFMMDYIFSGGQVQLVCPPPNSPIRPQPNDNEYVRYVQCYSTSDAPQPVDVWLDNTIPVEFLVLPIKVSIIEYVSPTQINTIVPTINSVTPYLGIDATIVSAQDGIINLRKTSAGNILPAGSSLIANLNLSAPATTFRRRVNIELWSLPPVQASENANYPLLIGPFPGRVTLSPSLVCDESNSGSQYVCCCAGMTGNVDCDPLEGVDISDLTALIDYMYVSMTPLCCPGEANVNVDPACSDIGDLSRLIDFLYISFDPLRMCR